jgi:HAD superfamily hydrolase (TIGR01484 family)
MRYLALACDFDGTLAHHGRVQPTVFTALRRLAACGRKLLLITGREVDDLYTVLPEVGLFDLVVAENGALLHRPADRAVTALAERPPARFVDTLRSRGVGPISQGRVVVATWHPHEGTVLEVIRDLGLELQIILNKGAVMVLPPGVTKASGLVAGLKTLGLSPRNTVGVGDAENDHSFLSICEYSVAVANALPAVKEQCDHVTSARHGAGVEELIDQLLVDELATWPAPPGRHDVLLGTRKDVGASDEVVLPVQGTNLLVVGSPGSGKSRLTAGLLQRLVERGYQVLVVDPEGDYDTFPDATHLGTSRRPPDVTEIMGVLVDPGRSVVVNLLGARLEERPLFLRQLLQRLHPLRAGRGRPHHIVIDEAHHLLPAEGLPPGHAPLEGLDGLVLLAPHGDLLSSDARETVDLVVTVGVDATASIGDFAVAIGVRAPDLGQLETREDEALAWWPARDETVLFRYDPGTVEHRRHVRKYAQGDVGLARAFHFRGNGDLDLPAHNLTEFLQLGANLDSADWLRHLRQGDYTRWFRDVIRDDELADEAEDVRRQHGEDATASRNLLRGAIERRYTAPG